MRLREGLEHLDQKAAIVLRWLVANKVDFVVVGPVAHAIRGDVNARGPTAVVPAPYGRNFERLCNALVAEHAGLRADRSVPGAGPQAVSVKLTVDKLARGKRWMLHFGDYDLDIEAAGGRAAVVGGAGSAGGGAGGGTRSRGPGYQELLYEATRVELGDGLRVEVASPEDLEHYSHLRLTGAVPEFRVTRTAQAEHETA